MIKLSDFVKRHNIKFGVSLWMASSYLPDSRIYLSDEEYKKWEVEHKDDIERFDRENREFCQRVVHSPIEECHDGHIRGHIPDPYPRFLKTELKPRLKYINGKWEK